jgi:hypothetical protein
VGTVPELQLARLRAAKGTQETYDRELEKLSDEARTWLLELQTKNFVKAGAVFKHNNHDRRLEMWMEVNA